MIYTRRNHFKTTSTIVMALLTTILFVTSCKKDDDPAPQKQGVLTLNFSNLEDLGSSAQYEGWIIVNGNAISTGRFTVDNNGTMSQTSFDTNLDDLNNASTFVLTIEPEPDPDPGASAVHILAGDFNGSSANTSVAHSAALGDDFLSSTGSYILATPTTTVTTDENSGVWFLDLSSGMPATGLSLPTLPNGWKYEGWAVVNGIPYSTGTFESVNGADDSAPFSGTDASAPPFPGEDFVTNAPSGTTFPFNIAGGAAVISIEPSPDNSPDPFSLKPLIGMVDASATDHVTYNLDNMVSSNFPAGMATR